MSALAAGGFVAVLVGLAMWLWGERDDGDPIGSGWSAGAGGSRSDVEPGGARPTSDAVPGIEADLASSPPAGGAATEGALDLGVVLTLARAALAGGASVPATLRALGACGAGEPLVVAGTALQLGSAWDEAQAETPVRMAPLMDALAPAWTAGADPDPLLAHAVAAVRARRSQEAEVAAAKLGVRLVLPLGLCYLPAFVALGLVPVVLSFVGDLLGG